MTDTPCPQAWHGGLSAGLLVECKYAEKHRGEHRNKANDLSWSGKLSAEEMEVATALREAKLEQMPRNERIRPEALFLAWMEDQGFVFTTKEGTALTPGEILGMWLAEWDAE